MLQKEFLKLREREFFLHDRHIGELLDIGIQRGCVERFDIHFEFVCYAVTQIPHGVLLENTIEIHVVFGCRALRNGHEFIDPNIRDAVDGKSAVEFFRVLQLFIRVGDHVNLQFLIVREGNRIPEPVVNANVVNGFGDWPDALGHDGNHALFIERFGRKQIDIFAHAVIEITGGKGGAAGQVECFDDVRIRKERV